MDGVQTRRLHRLLTLFSRPSLSMSVRYLWPPHMFWRLSITYVTLLLVAIGLLGVILTSRVDGYYQEQIRASLTTQAYLVRAAMGEWPAQPSASVQQRLKSLSQEV